MGTIRSSIIALIAVICLRNSIASEEGTFRGFKIPCNDTSKPCLKQTSELILSEFARGIPALGIDSLDPFIVDKVNLTMPGGLTIEFNRGHIKGFRKCIIDTASVIKDQFNISFHCDFTIKGKYRSSGKLFMFPIDGQGDVTIICKNLKIECSFKLASRIRNENEHLVLRKYDITHSYQGQVFYEATNIFKGNPEISNMVLEFMNRNWLTVAEEFGGPIIDFGIETIVKNVDKLIEIVPAKQLIRLN